VVLLDRAQVSVALAAVVRVTENRTWLTTVLWLSACARPSLRTSTARVGARCEGCPGAVDAIDGAVLGVTYLGTIT